MSNPEHMPPSKERRKWLKFVAVHGRYEKSVKICQKLPVHEYYQEFEPREVIAKTVAFSERILSVNGYFRLRTDREYYPMCGKYGIPDDERSGLAKDFEKHRFSGHEKGRLKKFRRMLADDEKQRRAKAAEDFKLAKNIPRYELAARMGIPVAMATDELLEAKRNQIATLRAIKQIRIQINENTNE